ncbi:MAG TPA: hypothetical protein PL048_15880 [Leptospiraceae bacterium]|nr:hypothetical protein [Leptospiraceae bacterium]HMZ60256.1 hypothetical protein [Leptospiraceae bacterium]HNF26900.1 hypothetical protein [Leptospiraceae bacterium]HNI27279.1 hypothetical protein [Leptospiraceae bacterium]HNI96972.1 hypothetical protein [Leptospiraceae bacterium]
MNRALFLWSDEKDVMPEKHFALLWSISIYSYYISSTDCQAFFENGVPGWSVTDAILCIAEEHRFPRAPRG